MAGTKNLVVLFLVFSFVFTNMHCASHVKRDQEESPTITEAANSSGEEGLEDCVQNSPCGWAVYNKLTRIVDYFMKNRCLCPAESKCLKDDDDISINAYVYRCKAVKRNDK